VTEKTQCRVVRELATPVVTGLPVMLMLIQQGQSPWLLGFIPRRCSHDVVARDGFL
jgi:hypothetical protein